MKLVSIGILVVFFGGVNVLLAMLAGAPTWVTLLAFAFGIVAAFSVAVIAGDMDEQEAPRERKPTKAKAELIVETGKEYKELEPGQSKSLVRY